MASGPPRIPDSNGRRVESPRFPAWIAFSATLTFLESWYACDPENRRCRTSTAAAVVNCLWAATLSQVSVPSATRRPSRRRAR